MYHVELRRFPHNMCRFNLTEQQMLAVAVPWANEDWVEFGERKWNANEAKMTILEGPKLAMSQLTMGRGWRAAQRKGEDVTERVFKALERAPAAPAQAGAQPLDPRAQEGSGQAAPTPAQAPSADRALLADSLGLEILALLDESPVAPASAWRLAGARLGERPASESLALAEGAVRSLLTRGLIVLQALGAGQGVGESGAQAADDVTGERIESLLSAPESWADGGQSPVVVIRRA